MSEPDYRLFLREGDLVTAEDVFQWLGTIDDDHDIVPIRKRSEQEPRTIAEWCRSLKPARMAVEDAIPLLRERLDRERRRALRRGALEEWRRMTWIVLVGWDTDGGLDSCTQSLDGGIVYASDHLANAIAFRAAARAK